MAKAKQTVKTAKSKAIKTPAKPKFSLSTLSNFKKVRLSDKRIYLAILVLGLILLISYKKSWFVAAMVNNTPITNFELLSRVNQQYRSQVLNQMINEKVILDEANKKHITITDKEINDRITQLEGSVGGGQMLDNLLAQQGMTRTEYKRQLLVQMSFEKMYEGEATISAEEVTKFIETNKDQLQATDSASQIKEATDLIKQQKLSKIFQDKFQQLKNAANIKIF